jgi:hypothetical protein
MARQRQRQLRQKSSPDRLDRSIDLVDCGFVSPIIWRTRTNRVPEVWHAAGLVLWWRAEETQAIEGIADLWIRLARYFDDFELQLDRMVKVPGYFDTIMTVTRTGVTVSEATLLYVFPHLLNQHTPGGHRGEGRLAGENELASRCSVSGWNSSA